MNKIMIKFNIVILLGFTLIACGSVKDDEMGLDERLAEYGYRPGENVDQIQSYRISDWTYLDSQHIMFSNGLAEQYLVSLKTNCRQLQSSETLLFKTRNSALSKFDEVIVPESGVSKHCSIESISKLHRTE